MTTDNKIKLVQLLGEYLTEKAVENRERKKDKWGAVVPTKALYTHARILHTKLSVEIESELKSTWDT